MRSSTTARGVTLAITVWLAACYTYVPVQGTPPVGRDIRVQLTTEAAVRASEQMDVVVRSYSGRVLSVARDTLSLGVVSGRALTPVAGRSLRQAMSIPMMDVASYEQRELSVLRTALIGGLGAAVIGGFLSGVVGGGTNDGNGGGPDENTFRPGLVLRIR